MVNRASQQLADSLTIGILDQDDVVTARDGIPAWLLLVDGLIQGSPQDAGMLIAGAARLYGAYAGGFIDDPVRAQHLSTRRVRLRKRATCIELVPLCKEIDAPFDAFQVEVAKTRRENVPVLYALATSWATRIRSNTSDWNAIADIPKVQALLERVVALAPDHAKGEPYMYLGVLATLRPASLVESPTRARPTSRRR